MDKSMETFVALLETISNNTMSTAQELDRSVDKLKDKLKLNHHPIMIENRTKWFVVNNLLIYLNTDLQKKFFGEMKYMIDITKDHMRSRDIFQVLMYFISNNIQNGILDNKLSKNDFFQFDQISIIEFAKYLQKRDSDWTKRILIRKENEHHLSYSNVNMRLYDFSKIIKGHALLKEHYFEKIDTYTLEDVEQIINALCQLGLKDVVSLFQPILENNCHKRMTKLKETIQPIELIHSSQAVAVSQESIPDYEYKQFKKEISAYYDIDQKEFKVDTLTKEERYYVVSKMLALNLSMEEIQEFLKRSKPKLIVSDNPFENYLQWLDELEYYKESLGLQDTIKNIHDYAYEMSRTIGNDYIFWKENLQNEMSKIISIFLDKNEFVMMQAEILLEQEKQKRKDF